MPPGRELGEEGSAQPPSVKREEPRNLEAMEDDEGGWAGHHEEVDYSKVGDSWSVWGRR